MKRRIDKVDDGDAIDVIAMATRVDAFLEHVDFASLRSLLCASRRFNHWYYRALPESMRRCVLRRCARWFGVSATESMPQANADAHRRALFENTMMQHCGLASIFEPSVFSTRTALEPFVVTKSFVEIGISVRWYDCRFFVESMCSQPFDCVYIGDMIFSIADFYSESIDPFVPGLAAFLQCFQRGASTRTVFDKIALQRLSARCLDELFAIFVACTPSTERDVCLRDQSGRKTQVIFGNDAVTKTLHFAPISNRQRACKGQLRREQVPECWRDHFRWTP